MRVRVPRDGLGSLPSAIYKVVATSKGTTRHKTHNNDDLRPMINLVYVCITCPVSILIFGHVPPNTASLGLLRFLTGRNLTEPRCQTTAHPFRCPLAVVVTTARWTSTISREGLSKVSPGSKAAESCPEVGDSVHGLIGPPDSS